MRVESRFAMRHVLVLVVLALVLNAQFTWWVVYSLRENGVRLRLERQLMVDGLRRVVARMRERLARLEASLPA
ncbi:MAG: hypothetical protein ACK42L_08765, partial [Thermoanaerobaculum sp.]